MSSITNITLAQVAQKGNELNFYSQFRTKVPYNSCKGSVIQVGTSWGGFGSLAAVRSGVTGKPSLNCTNSNSLILTQNISTNPAANGAAFLGFGYIGSSGTGSGVLFV